MWSKWLEKHPQTDALFAQDPGTVTALLEDPDTKVIWDKHVAETYYYYWEQYTYWAGQGWTVDDVSNCDNSESTAAPSDRDIETLPKECGDGTKSPQSSEFKAPQLFSNDTEALNALFGQSCTVDGAEGSVVDLGRKCGDVPQDGGNDSKKPVASSQQNEAEHTGKICMHGSVFIENSNSLT